MFRKFIFCLTVIFAVTFLFGSFASADGEICAEHSGSNKNKQSYEDNASPTASYLTVTDSGDIMRFQYADSGQYMLVQYFSEDYTLKSSTIIPAELSVFGGFCETENFYFVITGQENPDSDSDKEVFRITKYDKNWKRYASVPIKGTYTAIPFYKGTVRFAHSGDYLLIRTSHKMYPSIYSNDSQGNITFQLNTEEMKITAQMTGLPNLNYGRIENSFNQFIELDESDITVAVDCTVTDSVNSVKLINYNTTASDGDFSASHLSLCTCIDMFTQTENTLSSVGGFEISSSDYIVAGVAKAETGAKNIFISAVSKDTFSSSSVPYITFLTDYTDSEKSVSTPHLVKISSERFIVLWSYEENIFYTELDSSGKAVGETHTITGTLSDCAPIVNGDKIIWYTWENAEIMFYEISTENLSQNQTVTPKIHSFTDYISDGNADCLSDGTKTAVCDNCDKTDTVSDTGSAKGHELSLWQQTRSPDCTTEGEQKRSCSRCSYSETQILPTISHSEAVIPAVASTCTETGLTEGKKCSVCSTVTTAQKTVAKKSHTYKTTTTKATLNANGKKVTACSVCGYVSKTVAIARPKTIRLSTTKYTYNGKVRTPSVTVKDSADKTLKKDTDYTVKYENGRKATGKYTVTIAFKGNYSGTKKLTFTIVPKVTSKITATQTTTSITLKWSKVTGATGYRIYQYNSKTKKYEKIKTTTSRSYKVTNLKAGATYKFKIKAYSKVDGTTLWGSATDAFATATKPKTPTLKVSSTSKAKATLTWTNVSGESGYQIYYSTKKDSGFKKMKSCKANTKKAAKSDLKSGKTYYFKVRAYKKVDGKTIYGSFSSVKSVKIK